MGENCTTESPHSRCFGCWNSHQNSCRNVESHLGVWRGCIITYRQQNSQMLPVHLRTKLQVWTCECLYFPTDDLSVPGKLMKTWPPGHLRDGSSSSAAGRGRAQLLWAQTHSSSLLRGSRIKPSKSFTWWRLCDCPRVYGSWGLFSRISPHNSSSPSFLSLSFFLLSPPFPVSQI